MRLNSTKNREKIRVNRGLGCSKFKNKTMIVSWSEEVCPQSKTFTLKMSDMLLRFQILESQKYCQNFVFSQGTIGYSNSVRNNGFKKFS